MCCAPAPGDAWGVRGAEARAGGGWGRVWMLPRGWDFKPDPIPPYFGFPNSQTSGAKYGPTPAPGPDGSKTRGFRVHTRPTAFLTSSPFLVWERSSRNSECRVVPRSVWLSLWNNVSFSFQVDDVKSKGKDALQPRADMIKEQIAPLRSWVRKLGHYSCTSG